MRKFATCQRGLPLLMLFLIAAVALILSSSPTSEAKGASSLSGTASWSAQHSGSPVLLAAAKSRKKADPKFEWKKTGKQVYDNICAACHQANGQGLPATFPPLKGNEYVLARNPRNHILTILNGAQGRKINGVTYATPMPPFAGQLSDAQIAAVVNHERTSWGNHAPLVTPQDVKKLRGKK